MKKLAIISGVLAVLALGANTVLYLNSNAWVCRYSDMEGFSKEPSRLGWRHYANCKYGFATESPADWELIKATSTESALFPFMPGEVEQIIFTGEDPELAYTVRVFERETDTKWQSQVSAKFAAAGIDFETYDEQPALFILGKGDLAEGAEKFRVRIASNQRYGFIGQWLLTDTPEVPSLVEATFATFRPLSGGR